ncbi:MAG: hypothetical protein J7L39_02710 [Candidatus Aenigmarchaeota archaeon]|nr:hypothetical protein [Candidatus Aenigmarchaeota archaeon]
MEMEARAFLRNANVSLKNAIPVCDKLRGMNVNKAIRFLEDLLKKKASIDGKYYTKTVKIILEVLKAAKANALQKNMNEERLYIKIIKADKGERIILPKRAKFAGRVKKTAHITIVLGER